MGPGECLDSSGYSYIPRLTAVVKILAENTGMIMIRRFGGARTRVRETSTLQYASKREHSNGQKDSLMALDIATYSGLCGDNTDEGRCGTTNAQEMRDTCSSFPNSIPRPFRQSWVRNENVVECQWQQLDCRGG